ncbi:hypothetical protein Ahy_B01g056817 [Arachis hypogaea]|uniref:NB-ARC domain-containing protein n=1 Tax=Arachis hypogaea TaxID=3818 RepID=A0A445AZR0_ARAHY|nr:hypothetical protein Ahy_B01g056817 [Arachis hypogaea]
MISKMLMSDDLLDRVSTEAGTTRKGGVGKPTIAELVYNDESLKQIYDRKMWIYVSKIFHIQKITKNMIEVVNSSRCNIKDLGFLQLDLKEKLMGKKYLVVLDNV